ncbi:MAG: N-acetylmuramoyl-L-alanine amidase [Lachnospiraceae bacterium]|nr:N-acetylmuramoyl-L-alanine amidase [Lachnospiraceae bacterium]
MKKIKKLGVAFLLLSMLVSFGGESVVTVYATETSSTETITTSSSNTTTTVKKLKFTKKKTKLKAGKTYKFKVNLKNAKWSVSDKKKAKITSSGKFTAKKYGTVKVTAKVGKQKVTCKVKVTPKAVIGIDPGHQSQGNYGKEPMGPGSSVYKTKVAAGTRGRYTGLPEYKLTLRVAKKLKKELVNRGYKVVMTRTSNDVNISNKERAELLNKECDIAIRLHADGSNNSSVSGVTMLYPSASNPYVGYLSAKSESLSNNILLHYCCITGLKNRGLSKRDDLTGTNWSTIPVTLIELGFMTNAYDDSYMANDSNQKVMAEGIADGIDDYFN